MRLQHTPSVSRNENRKRVLVSDTVGALRDYTPGHVRSVYASMPPYLKQIFARDVILPKALTGVELQLSDYSFEVLRCWHVCGLLSTGIRDDIGVGN